MEIDKLPDILVCRGDGGGVSADMLEYLRHAISRGNVPAVVHIAQSMHEADLADLLEFLDVHERQAFVQICGDKFNFLVLTEVDETVCAEILSWIQLDVIVKAIHDLETDDAVHILGNVDKITRKKIIDRLPTSEGTALARGLNYPQKTAGRHMQTEFISVPPFWTIGQTIDHMREADNLPDDFYEIFVVDPEFRPIGTVPLNRLLRTQRPARMDSIIDDSIYKIDAKIDQEEVAHIFKRYDLVSAAVTDEAGMLVGMITVDDIIDVIEEEADEDIRHLSGIGDESLSDLVIDTVRSRFTWLMVNLMTAILASWVISHFDKTLEQMVALAVLMPIVASMGGNAGTQTMTVAVRALATGSLVRFNIRRVIMRESMASFINGCMFAIILGIIVAVWFGNIYLGIVIGFAMIINLLVAGFCGVTIPFSLHRMGFDPAIASGAFVTMVTDMIGFLAFLGLATWWFGLV